MEFHSTAYSEIMKLLRPFKYLLTNVCTVTSTFDLYPRAQQWAPLIVQLVIYLESLLLLSLNERHLQQARLCF